ncbi:FAD-dependent oxidoreductase [Metarhizobium album]|uniref:FAD-dependent oxidoreductase n=1 Tax=Metarhizobium album TaxID=2182425 RepID=A0A2U2DXV1_9HYPH|nr:FAD-dependent oxidoreductase [Rhizobium album]PWE58141.1 FAD-dependent oxidoreductase [Rhizobium album]
MSTAELSFEHTTHRDLVGGKSPWGGLLQRPPGAPLQESFAVDVAIVGGGITGALAAERMTALGFTVALIDREQPGLGSTAASTAMLQWEIDCTLTELAGFYGFDRAAAIYRRSLAAVSGLSQLAASLSIPCDFHPRSTFYVAGPQQEPHVLAQEFELRHRAELPSRYMSAHELASQFRIDRPAALLSPGSAEADPLMLCWALLNVARSRGARLVEATATHFHEEGGTAVIETDGRHVVEARHVLLATGYVMPHFVMPKQHSTASSWAIATVPQPLQHLWPDRTLIWEATEPYLYLRTTFDNRIIIGGEDEDIADPQERDAKLPRKIEILRQKLLDIWPSADPTISHAWCGAFGETEDGLPLIGRVPGTRRIFAAYGYGGNGITFSYMAAHLAAAFVTGKEPGWFEDFALDRPAP